MSEICHEAFKRQALEDLGVDGAPETMDGAQAAYSLESPKYIEVAKCHAVACHCLAQQVTSLLLFLTFPLLVSVSLESGSVCQSNLVQCWVGAWMKRAQEKPLFW